jgi:hypothetical protein
VADQETAADRRTAPDQKTAPHRETAPDPGAVASVSALPVHPGMCADCRHALVKETHRGTAYLRCGRAAWDDRLVRYPRLPVTDCEGFAAVDQ